MFHNKKEMDRLDTLDNELMITIVQQSKNCAYLLDKCKKMGLCSKLKLKKIQNDNYSHFKEVVKCYLVTLKDLGATLNTGNRCSFLFMEGLNPLRIKIDENNKDLLNEILDIIGILVQSQAQWIRGDKVNSKRYERYLQVVWEPKVNDDHLFALSEYMGNQIDMEHMIEI